MEMAREGEEGADTELDAALKRISPLLDRVELTAKMTGEHDASDAFIEIHPGAKVRAAQRKFAIACAQGDGAREVVLGMGQGEAFGIHPGLDRSSGQVDRNLRPA